ncbi:MAG: NAD-dependent epimerase/dehydratase family protein [bacterium]
MGFWKDIRVFITGITGLLGSSLSNRLKKEGAFIVGLIRDRVCNSNLNYSGINIVHGELTDHYLVERVINEYEIDTVFHLGAQTIVTIANRDPLSTFESNIRGTYNLLEACRNLSAIVKRIIVSSSDKAYGEHKELPYKEDYPLRGLHPYDCSKSCVDLLSQCYIHTYYLPIAIARCGNIYGEGDFNFNRIIPGTILSLLKNERPIIRSDGSPKRDYIYVLDIVDGLLKLGENMENPDVRGEAFNFSNEEPFTVIEVVEKIEKIMKKENLAPVIFGETRGEIRNQYLSCQKARDILKFSPKYSLDKGLSLTIKWYEENFLSF